VVHLVSRHEQAEQRPEVMVRHRPGEGAPLDRLPELPALLGLAPVAGDDAALGPEERLVGRSGDDVGALGEGLLEVGPDETEDVRHVVHQHRPAAGLVEEAPHLGHRLGMEDHALAEDDELRVLLGDEVEEGGYVGLVRVVLADGDVLHGGHLGARVPGDEVAQGAHRLGTQVPALGDVVVDDLADASRLGLAVAAVEVVDQGAEDGGIGHLAANHPRLDLGAAEERAQFLLQQPLDLVDERRALVVEDLEVVEGLRLLVLGVAEGRVGHAEEAHERRGRHLGRDEV